MPKLYGPVEETIITGISGEVRNTSVGYGAITFNGTIFLNKVKSELDMSKTVDYLLMVSSHKGDSQTLTLYYTDGTSYVFENGAYVVAQLYGIDWTRDHQYNGNDYIDLTETVIMETQSKQISKLYGPVEIMELNGVTGEIRSGGNVLISSFNASEFWTETETYIDTSKTLSYLRALYTSTGKSELVFFYLGYTDGTESASLPGTLSPVSEPTSPHAYGVHLLEWADQRQVSLGNSYYIDLTPTYTTSSQAKQIIKLYGSVGGQTKRIF